MKSMIVSALVVAAAASMSSLEARSAEPPAVVPQAEQAAPAKVAPHSHLQEKTGMTPQKKPAKAKSDETKAAPAAEEAPAGDAGAAKPAVKKSARTRADKDKSRHYHPRDAK